MSTKRDFDVSVIGGGPAGYVAAIRAAQLGARTCLIERADLGGCCTNVGCIPTKVLVHAAWLYRQAARAERFGVRAADVRLNWAAAAARRDSTIPTLRKGIESLLAANDVELIRATASFEDHHSLRLNENVAENRLSADKFIVATGSRAVELPVAPFDHEAILSSDDAVMADELPQSVIVVGGGYIGVEFASMYASCGVEVTIVEMLDSLLPGTDEDCAREVTRSLKKARARVLTGVTVERVSKDGGVRARLSDGSELTADRMLVCVGRRPCCEGLKVQRAGVEIGDNGQIVTNEHMQTSAPHIYAAGDVVGPPMLAHVASQEGLVAAAHATGSLTAAMDYRAVPSCVFASLEVASVGMTERDAREAVGEVTVKKFPFRALGKAHVTGDTDGFVKLVCKADTGELLGVHICGADASSLIGEATLALRLECTAEELAETIHAHPTLPEALREAADGVIGLPINWRG